MVRVGTADCFETRGLVVRACWFVVTIVNRFGMAAVMERWVMRTQFVEGSEMKPSDDALPAVGKLERESLQPRKLAAETLQCLIASASQTRRNMLSQAATDAGWGTVVTATPDNAIGRFRRTSFQFAMVDLDDRGGTPPGVQDLVQTLAHDSSRILLGVCGHEADPEEEIWVRQLGIWLYLPGVTSSSEVSQLCEQALQVVMKRLDEEEVSSRT